MEFSGIWLDEFMVCSCEFANDLMLERVACSVFCSEVSSIACSDVQFVFGCIYFVYLGSEF